MRGPFTPEEFAALLRVDLEVVEACRDAGLLDPERQGTVDGFDVLRFHFVRSELAKGKTPDEVASEIREGRMHIPFFGDRLFRLRAPLYSVEEASTMIGLEPGQIETLRRITGLAGTWVDADDVEALKGIASIVAAGIPWESIVEVTRVFGDAIRRITEAEAKILHRLLHEPAAATGAAEQDLALQTSSALETMEPIIVENLEFVHRQYLLRAVVDDVLQHLEPARGADATIETTIAFVDLSSFTTLADVQGDEVAAGVVERLDDLVRTHLYRREGTLVKQIGDAVMLTFRDPAEAVAFALALDEEAAKQENFPSLRIGIHHGPVLYRVGDYIGAAVNLAARVAAAAMAGEIVVTEPVAKAAEGAGLPVSPLGMRMLRGVAEAIPLYRVVPRRQRAVKRDPVCGVVVGASPAGVLGRDGVEYVFCSEDCLRRFLDDPDRYAITP